MDRKSSNRRRRLAFLRLNSLKASHKSGSIFGKKLDVQYDDWAETTSDRHKKVVQGILQRLFDEGKIYKDKQSGYYSVRQEQFLTDKERGPDGQFGPGVGRDRVSRRGELLLSSSAGTRIGCFSYIEPSHRTQSFPIFVKRNCATPSRKPAITASPARTSASRGRNRAWIWGIELPFDEDFVTYVWFDALTNYISFAGYDPSLDFHLSTLYVRPRCPGFRDSSRTHPGARPLWRTG